MWCLFPVSGAMSFLTWCGRPDTINRECWMSDIVLSAEHPWFRVQDRHIKPPCDDDLLWEPPHSVAFCGRKSSVRIINHQLHDEFKVCMGHAGSSRMLLVLSRLSNFNLDHLWWWLWCWSRKLGRSIEVYLISILRIYIQAHLKSGK